MLKNTCEVQAIGPRSLRTTTARSNGWLTAFAAHHRSLRPGEDIRSARLWLAEGIPIGDVLTMLEARHRFELSLADCRAYAVQILWSAEALCQLETDRIPNPKESRNAAA